MSERSIGARPAAARRRRRTSSRLRKAWLSVFVTLAGSLALGVLAWRIQERQSTDLADASAAVTTGFLRAEEAGAPPIRFTDVAKERGVEMSHGPGTRGRTLPEDTGSGLAWGDVNGDGRFDLYAVNIPGALGAAPGPESSNRLFLNLGGHFRDATEEAGVGDPEGFGMGAFFADYDGDARLDLYVTNFGPNRLFRNRGEGTFDEVAARAGVDDPSWSTGAAWGDYDRDGNLDLYVCNYVRYDDGGVGPEVLVGVPKGGLGVPFTLNPNSFDPQPNRLYRNRGDGTFEDVAVAAGVQDPRGRSLCAAFCDLDGDGWLDLYVNNDVSTNQLFRNLGGELGEGRAVRFMDLSTFTGTADPRGSMGLSVAEIGWMDGAADGLPDLFITHWVAQENAIYQSLRRPDGNVEYRDRTRQFGLGEISIDRVGWGSAFVDLDLDGRIDLVVVNGSTLEERERPLLLRAEPLFLFWNDGRRFHDVAPSAGPDASGLLRARGLAACDFDGDGAIDLAVAQNRGPLLLLRNETAGENRSLAVRLDGPAVACFGARVELRVEGAVQVRWHGADVSYLGTHAPEHVFGLGTAARADSLHVRWADGAESALEQLAPGRVVVPHPGRARADLSSALPP